QRLQSLDDPHPTPAAARRRLDQQGRADPSRLFTEPRVRLVLARIAWHDRHACGGGELLCGDLVAEQTEDGGRRTDEDYAGTLASLGKVGIFGEEAIAGMDRIR